MYLAEIDISNKAFNPVARFSNLADVVNLIIPIIMGIAFVLFFVTFLRAGFIILTSGGDIERYKRGQKSFKYAIGGFILILFSYLIVKLVNKFFGTEIPL
jgi:hypothetical protein